MNIHVLRCRMRVRFAVWLLPSLIVPGGCLLAEPGIPVRVALPRIGGDWPRESIAGYVVEWYDGSLQSFRVSAGVDTVHLELPARRGLAVLVHPVLHSGDRLRPAGALVPDHLSAGGTLRPAWEGGAAATVMMQIARRTGAPERYHGARLFRELWDRTGGEPWSADLDALTDQLISGSFRSTAIRPRPRSAVTVGAPPGGWLRDLPTATVLPRNGIGEITLELEEGVHRLHHPETGSTLTVSVDARGEVLTFLTERRY